MPSDLDAELIAELRRDYEDDLSDIRTDWIPEIKRLVRAAPALLDMAERAEGLAAIRVSLEQERERDRAFIANLERRLAEAETQLGYAGEKLVSGGLIAIADRAFIADLERQLETALAKLDDAKTLADEARQRWHYPPDLAGKEERVAWDKRRAMLDES